MDYLVVIALTEFGNIWYVYSNIVGASFGAITNFLLGRFWAFDSIQDSLLSQGFRYALVFLGSVFLNTLGLYLLTEFSPLTYIPSKIIIAILVAVTYNYLMQKYFVYKK